MKKIANIVISIFFMVCLTLPLVNFDMSSEINEKENRTLAKFPKIENINSIFTKDFVSEFEEFFSDRIGFRKEIIDINLKLRYKLTGKLYNDSFMPGQKGHWYYINNQVMDNFQYKAHMSANELENFSNTVQVMKNYANNSGANFIYMNCVNKETIYPEYFLKGVNKPEEGTSMTEELLQYINENTDVDAFSTKDAMLDYKLNNKDLVYYKSYDGSHWNNKGAYIGYLELMKHVKRYLPDIKILKENEDFEFEEKYLKKIVSGCADLSENSYIINMINPDEYEDIKEIPEGLSLEYPMYYHHIHNKERDDLPKAFILGDSYIYSFLFPLLSQSFSDIYFVRYSEGKNYCEFIDMFEPDIVIYEFVDRMFHSNQYQVFKDIETIN